MRVLTFFILVFSFTACNQEAGKGIFVDLDKPEKVSLFDYFSTIELIPFETSPESLVSGISKMIIHNGDYYVLDMRQCIIFVFDKIGKFLFKIDKKGESAGEYTFISDFNINPFTGNLELLEPYGRIYIYDIKGSFIEQKQIKYKGFRVAHKFAALTNDIHVFYSMFAPKKIIYFNLTEQKLISEEFEEDRDLGAFSRGPYQYNDNWYFFRPIHPVVYQMEYDGLEEAFRFNFGKYTEDGLQANFSDESQCDFSRKIDELYAQFPYLIREIRHNDRYVFASLFWKDDTQKANIIYDKTTEESKFILEFVEEIEFNSYLSEEFIVTNESVLMPTQWIDLEKRIKREMLNEKQQVIFEKLINSKQEENPILIKYNFK